MSRMVVAVVLVCIIAVYARVLTASHAEFAEATAFERQNDIESAIIHYRRAVRWYAPINPYPERAVQKLFEIAKASEAIGLSQRALDVYRSIRGAINATRSTYTPYLAYREQADHQIARLMASMPPPRVDADKTVAERQHVYAMELAATHRPKVFWAILALFGFGLWAVSALWLFSKAITQDNRIVLPRFIWCLAAIALGFVLFGIGLLQA